MNETNHQKLRRRRRHVRDAVVLAAGRGSRLRPLTDTTPKCLVSVNGAPLIVRLLRQLTEIGVHRAWIVVGYLGDEIRDALRDVDGLPELAWVNNETWDSYNNAESVRTAMAAMDEPQPFLLCDGDVYVADERFLADMACDPRDNVLGVELRFHHTLADEDMKFQLEPVDVPWYSRRVVGLGKELVSRWCHGESIGFQVVGGSAFDDLVTALDELSESDREALYYEDVFARLISDGHEFYTHAVQPDAWVEIDTAEDLEAARRRFDMLPRAAHA